MWVWVAHISIVKTKKLRFFRTFDRAFHQRPSTSSAGAQYGGVVSAVATNGDRGQVVEQRVSEEGNLLLRATEACVHVRGCNH